MVNVVHKVSPQKGFTGHEKMSNLHQLPFRLKTSVWCWKAAASFFPSWEAELLQSDNFKLVENTPSHLLCGIWCRGLLMLEIQEISVWWWIFKENIWTFLNASRDQSFYFTNIWEDYWGTFWWLGWKYRFWREFEYCMGGIQNRHKLRYLFNDIFIIWNKRVT